MIRIPGKIDLKNVGRNIRSITPWEEKKEKKEKEERRLREAAEALKKEEALREALAAEEREQVLPEPEEELKVEPEEPPLVESQEDVYRPPAEDIEPIFTPQPKPQEITEEPVVDTSLIEDKPKPTYENGYNLVEDQSNEDIDKLRSQAIGDFNKGVSIYAPEYKSNFRNDIQARQQFPTLPVDNGFPKPQIFDHTGRSLLPGYSPGPERARAFLIGDDGRPFTPKEQSLNAFLRVASLLPESTQNSLNNLFKTYDPMRFATEETLPSENPEALLMSETIVQDMSQMMVQEAGAGNFVGNTFNQLLKGIPGFLDIESPQAKLDRALNLAYRQAPQVQPARANFFQAMVYDITTGVHNGVIQHERNQALWGRHLASASGNTEEFEAWNNIIHLLDGSFRQQADLTDAKFEGRAFHQQFWQIAGSQLPRYLAGAKGWVLGTPASMLGAAKVLGVSQLFQGPLVASPVEEIMSFPALVLAGNMLFAQGFYMKDAFIQSAGEALSEIGPSEEVTYTLKGTIVGPEAYAQAYQHYLSGNTNYKAEDFHETSENVYNPATTLIATGTALFNASLDYVGMKVVGKFFSPLIRKALKTVDPSGIYMKKIMPGIKELAFQKAPSVPVSIARWTLNGAKMGATETAIEGVQAGVVDLASRIEAMIVGQMYATSRTMGEDLLPDVGTMSKTRRMLIGDDQYVHAVPSEWLTEIDSGRLDTEGNPIITYELNETGINKYSRVRRSDRGTTPSYDRIEEADNIIFIPMAKAIDSLPVRVRRLVKEGSVVDTVLEEIHGVWKGMAVLGFLGTGINVTADIHKRYNKATGTSTNPAIRVISVERNQTTGKVEAVWRPMGSLARVFSETEVFTEPNEKNIAEQAKIVDQGYIGDQIVLSTDKLVTPNETDVGTTPYVVDPKALEEARRMVTNARRGTTQNISPIRVVALPKKADPEAKAGDQQAYDFVVVDQDVALFTALKETELFDTMPVKFVSSAIHNETGFARVAEARENNLVELGLITDDVAKKERIEEGIFDDIGQSPIIVFTQTPTVSKDAGARTDDKILLVPTGQYTIDATGDLVRNELLAGDTRTTIDETLDSFVEVENLFSEELFDNTQAFEEIDDLVIPSNERLKKQITEVLGTAGLTSKLEDAGIPGDQTGDIINYVKEVKKQIIKEAADENNPLSKEQVGEILTDVYTTLLKRINATKEVLDASKLPEDSTLKSDIQKVQKQLREAIRVSGSKFEVIKVGLLEEGMDNSYGILQSETFKTIYDAVDSISGVSPSTNIVPIGNDLYAPSLDSPETNPLLYGRSRKEVIRAVDEFKERNRSFSPPKDTASTIPIEERATTASQQQEVSRIFETIDDAHIDETLRTIVQNLQAELVLNKRINSLEETTWSSPQLKEIVAKKLKKKLKDIQDNLSFFDAFADEANKISNANRMPFSDPVAWGKKGDVRRRIDRTLKLPSNPLLSDLSDVVFINPAKDRNIDIDRLKRLAATSMVLTPNLVTRLSLGTADGRKSIFNTSTKFMQGENDLLYERQRVPISSLPNTYVGYPQLATIIISNQIKKKLGLENDADILPYINSLQGLDFKGQMDAIKSVFRSDDDFKKVTNDLFGKLANIKATVNALHLRGEIDVKMADALFPTWASLNEQLPDLMKIVNRDNLKEIITLVLKTGNPTKDIVTDNKKESLEEGDLIDDLAMVMASVIYNVDFFTGEITGPKEKNLRKTDEEIIKDIEERVNLSSKWNIEVDVTHIPGINTDDEIEYGTPREIEKPEPDTTGKLGMPASWLLRGVKYSVINELWLTLRQIEEDQGLVDLMSYVKNYEVAKHYVKNNVIPPIVANRRDGVIDPNSISSLDKFFVTAAKQANLTNVEVFVNDEEQVTDRNGNTENIPRTFTREKELEGKIDKEGKPDEEPLIKRPFFSGEDRFTETTITKEQLWIYLKVLSTTNKAFDGAIPRELYDYIPKLKNSSDLSNVDYRALIGSTESEGILNGPHRREIQELFNKIENNRDYYITQIIRRARMRDVAISLKDADISDFSSTIEESLEEARKVIPLRDRPVEGVQEVSSLEIALANMNIDDKEASRLADKVRQNTIVPPGKAPRTLTTDEISAMVGAQQFGIYIKPERMSDESYQMLGRDHVTDLFTHIANILNEDDLEVVGETAVSVKSEIDAQTLLIRLSMMSKKHQQLLVKFLEERRRIIEASGKLTREKDSIELTKVFNEVQKEIGNIHRIETDPESSEVDVGALPARRTTYNVEPGRSVVIDFDAIGQDLQTTRIDSHIIDELGYEETWELLVDESPEIKKSSEKTTRSLGVADLKKHKAEGVNLHQQIGDREVEINTPKQKERFTHQDFRKEAKGITPSNVILALTADDWLRIFFTNDIKINKTMINVLFEAERINVKQLLKEVKGYLETNGINSVVVGGVRNKDYVNNKEIGKDSQNYSFDGMWILNPQRDATVKYIQHKGEKKIAVTGQKIKNSKTSLHLSSKYIGVHGKTLLASLVGVDQTINYINSKNSLILHDVIKKALWLEGVDLPVNLGDPDSFATLPLRKELIKWLPKDSSIDVHMMRRDTLHLLKSISERVNPKTTAFHKRLIELMTQGMDTRFLYTGKVTRKDSINEQLRDFVRKHEDSELSQDIPIALIERILTKSFSTWTFDEMVEFEEKISQLREIGRLEWQNGRLEIENTVEEDLTAILKEMNRFSPIKRKSKINKKVTDPTRELTKDEQFELSEEIKRQKRTFRAPKVLPFTAQYKASELRPMRLFDYLGRGAGQFDGPVYDLFITKVLDSHEKKQRSYLVREQAMIKALNKIQKIKKLRNSMAKLHNPTKDLKRGDFALPRNNQLMSDELKNKKLELRRDEILHVYAMTLTDAGKAALEFSSLSISEEMQNEIVKRVTKKEKQIVEVIIQENEANYDRINDALHKQLPVGVERRSDRQVYWPTESTKNTSSMDEFLREEEETFFALDFFTARRDVRKIMNLVAEGKVPPRPSLGLIQSWWNRLEREEKFIHQYELMKQLRDTYNDERFERQVIGDHGLDMYKAVDRYINRFTRGNYKTFESTDPGYWNRAFEHIRKGFAPNVLAWQVSTVLKQGPSMALFAAEVGWSRLLHITDTLSLNPVEYKQARDFILKHDISMKERSFNREVDDLRIQNPTVFEKLIKAGYNPGLLAISTVDEFVTTIGWIAVYERMKDKGASDEEAIQRARDIIKRTQPSSFIMDVAEAYDTQQPFWRAVRQFTTQVANINNMLFYDLPRSALASIGISRGNLADRMEMVAPEGWKQAARQVSALGMNWVMMYIITYGEVPFMTAETGEMPDETLTSATANEILFMLLKSLGMYAPVIGGMASSIASGFAPVTVPGEMILQSAYNFIMGNERWSPWRYARALTEVLGGVLHAPPIAVSKDALEIAEYLYEQNPDVFFGDLEGVELDPQWLIEQQLNWPEDSFKGREGVLIKGLRNRSLEKWLNTPLLPEIIPGLKKQGEMEDFYR